jgi:rod shape-determining protein MreD
MTDSALPPPPRPHSIALLVLAMLAAAGIQSVLPGAVAASGLRVGGPDLVLVFALVAALLSDAGTGCLVGFGAGLLTAALVGETVGTFLVSRAVAGFVAGSLAGRFFRTNAAVVIAAVIVGAFVAGTVYGLAAPPVRGTTFLAYLRETGLGILWDGALALPIASLMRRFGWGEGKR